MEDASSCDGKGQIVLSRYGDTQSLSKMSFQYPLKLISPRLPSQQCTSVFMMSYGGGLVGGDKIDLSVTVEKGCKLALLTQGSTKVFKERTMSDSSTSPPTTQQLQVTIQDGALLALLPDPIQPFGGSTYTQNQSFEMHSDSNLILLDWVNSGRPARGEIWTLNSFRSRNDIWTSSIDGDERRLLLRDTLILNENIQQSMFPHQCFATLILRGPIFRTFSESVVDKFKNEEKVRRPSTMHPTPAIKRAIWTAGIVRDGCCVAKMAGEDGESVKSLLRELLLVQEMESVLGREALRGLV
jgi:urease accessory protein